jgi:murein DD-endopeptidase MepM/ murein hydrolase activator NlpD
MIGKKLTLLVTDERERLRQYSFEARTLRRAMGGAGFLGLGLLASLVLFGVRGPVSLEQAQLERKNELLTAELSSIRERVSELEGEIESLARKDAEVRILAGLDTIDEEVLQVGVGGPGSPSLETEPLYLLDEEIGKQAFAASYDLIALERRARLLRESITEAADSLAAHRDLLESTPSILPTAGLLTSRFTRARLHPIHHRELPHEGIDVSAPRGTPILAAAKGRVVFAGRRAGYGLVIEIDHGHGYSTLYGHASQLRARVGQQVQRGEVVAQVGSTGLATSPHLHYEVRVGGRPVNPLNYIITGAVP